MFGDMAMSTLQTHTMNNAIPVWTIYRKNGKTFSNTKVAFVVSQWSSAGWPIHWCYRCQPDAASHINRLCKQQRRANCRRTIPGEVTNNRGWGVMAQSKWTLKQTGLKDGRRPESSSRFLTSGINFGWSLKHEDTLWAKETKEPFGGGAWPLWA